MLATAYCSNFGPGSINGTGITSGGTDLRDGKQHNVVAAGPGSGLKRGDKIRIGPDPFGGDGSTVWTVDDTGGAIVGAHIDLYIADCAAARRWGRKMVTVVAADLSQPDSSVAPTEKSNDPANVVKNSADAIVGVANSIGDLAAITEKFVASLFSSATWFRVGKVVVGVLLGLFGIIILARPAINSLPPAVKTAAKVAV